MCSSGVQLVELTSMAGRSGRSVQPTTQGEGTSARVNRVEPGYAARCTHWWFQIRLPPSRWQVQWLLADRNDNDTEQ